MSERTMAPQVKILAFAGSLRSGSLNKKLVQAAARFAEQAGAEVTLIDLRDLNIPLYDGDIEASSGIPDGAVRLKQLMATHDALLISSPEYNSSISGALKNAIDWASRQAPGEAPLQSFSGKVGAVVSASPGSLGGLRSLLTTRGILDHLGVLVIPEKFAVANANQAFDDAGNLREPKQAAAVEKVVRRLVEVTAKSKA
jgi:NAD(P)H-dependent FMN reductase